jgi:hypothetical protein
MRITSRTSDEHGIALVTALLAVLLATALMAGMFASLSADQRSHAVDRDQSQVYAAAHAGLEKLTSNLAQLFATDFSPSVAQIDAMDNTPPAITGFTYTSPGGGANSGYAVTFNPDANGNPAANANADITTGPFTGFKGLITPYTITVTARSTGGSEVRLRREIQTVAVPVFQFGIFGERSLSFHAGANFDFGGRVHTNEHLFLAEGSGATLTFRDKLTAVGQVVRSQLENGNAITDSGHTGTVKIPTVIGSTYRNLAATEGSVVHGPGSAAVSGWKTLSEDTYKTNIRNTKTGAKRLDLPLVSQGAAPIDLIRRPRVNSNENVVNQPVFLQRYFAQASLRILLSDRTDDITGLPTVTATLPVPLDSTFAPPAGMPKMARSVGPQSANITATGGTGSNGTGTITFAALPNWLKMPATNYAIGASTVSGCTGMTATTLTGCTVAGAPTPLNTDFTVPLTIAGNSGDVASLRTSGGGSATVGANKTVTLVSTRDLALGARLIWSAGSPVTCSGYSNAANQLTGCYWSVAPAGSVQTHALSAEGSNQIGGFIKIEKQNAAGVWSDVTLEILNLGFSAPNQQGGSAPCADPTPDAVIRLQRWRDNGIANTVACAQGATTMATDYWPNALYDAREGAARDLATNAPMTMGGVVNYVSLDVNNLRRWLTGAIGLTGTQALNNNGYIVYFSDRRGNHDDAAAGQPETGEYGNEDSINQAAGAGSSAANGVLESGEDRNENATLQTYGATPSALATYGAAAPFDATSNPLTTIASAPQARINRQVFFRRALKLINGGISGGVNNLPASGLTVATENGVYVQGNYNATSDDVEAEPNRPAAILGDAVTILSNSWTDARSFNYPNDMNNRNASTTGYRFGLIAGKSIAFPKPGWAGAGDAGTDGGVHNFMRMLEDWSGQTINYRGSIVSLYTARQWIGIYRANSNTYAPGTREFAFDTDFLTPTLLPPGTPMFRDINTLKFRQILRPNQ